MITEDFPFDEETLAVKVSDKAFLFSDITQDPPWINLKCDPERAIELRARFDAVRPGYHMNKKHWNTVVIDGSIPDEEILRMVDHSFDCVVKGLRKGAREKLGGRGGTGEGKTGRRKRSRR